MVRQMLVRTLRCLTRVAFLHVAVVAHVPRLVLFLVVAAHAHQLQDVRNVLHSLDGHFVSPKLEATLPIKVSNKGPKFMGTHVVVTREVSLGECVEVVDVIGQKGTFDFSEHYFYIFRKFLHNLII